MNKSVDVNADAVPPLGVPRINPTGYKYLQNIA